jgi:hypothetical protein
VRVSPEARKAYLSLTRGAALPVGSIVAMFHEQAEGHAPGPVYVMHKQSAGWQYLVLAPDGHIRAQSDMALCERCHAEATADHLFGWPAGNDPRSGGGIRAQPESTQAPGR